RFLMFHTEALLLIDNNEAEVFKFHFAGQDSVGTDQHIYRAVSRPIAHLFRLLIGLEARKRRDIYWDTRIASRESFQVLLNEERGGNQSRDLFAVLNGLKRRAHRDLGFSVAHASANEAVQRKRLLHIGLSLVNRDELIGSCYVVKRVFK